MKLGFLWFWWLSSSLKLESASYLLIVVYITKVWILDHCDIFPINLQGCKFRRSSFSYACHHHFLDFFSKARIQRCGFPGYSWMCSRVLVGWIKALNKVTTWFAIWSKVSHIWCEILLIFINRSWLSLWSKHFGFLHSFYDWSSNLRLKIGFISWICSFDTKVSSYLRVLR